MPIANGGTGATSAAKALSNLGAAASGHIQDVSHGGTGATTVATARTALGIGTLGTLNNLNGATTENAYGYTIDQYGNFIHKSTSTGNTWNIINNSGATKFSVDFESGDISVTGVATLAGGVNNNLVIKRAIHILPLLILMVALIE